MGIFGRKGPASKPVGAGGGSVTIHLRPAPGGGSELHLQGFDAYLDDRLLAVDQMGPRGVFVCRVAGVTRHPTALQAPDFAVLQAVRYHREPNNAHDKNAIAVFARKVVDLRGKVSDADIATARAAGLTDAHVIEVIANVAINILTNYTNNVALTDIDFPKVNVALAA